MGRMRKEIMGKFLQSLWDSIRDSTSLKEGLVALKENKKKKQKEHQDISFSSKAKQQIKMHYKKCDKFTL